MLPAMRSISARPLLVMMRPPSAVLHHLQLLKLMHCLANDRARGLREVSFLCTTMGTAGASVPLLQCTHTSSLAKVNLASNRGSTGVKPVLIIWGELLECAGLHNVVILGHIELGLTLQKVGTGLDKSISWYIFHGDTATGHPFVSH